jgi:hypothetical protein
MKVSELIQKLQRLDPDAMVLCYTEDEGLPAKGHSFRLLDVESVDAQDVVLSRADDGVPSATFGKGAGSRTIAVLNVIADF